MKYTVAIAAFLTSFFISPFALAQTEPLNEQCKEEKIKNVQVAKDCLDRLEMRIRLVNRLTREAAEDARHYASLAIFKSPWDALYATQMAVKLDPDHPGGWKQLGTIWTILGNKKEATAAYEKANSLTKEKP